ncbi:helix-turn-helix domain-containing protein [Pseudomonas sp. Fl5BN2]|uniref:helix-turn-helix domain-containing protein n=1 Tax=unclassified Pseudomonas TaxID=196821 RepID=UPI0013786855|nr:MULTISPECIES: helix-turn-helix transcriptional regulator [unclassified Pseudomonas]NBF05981.1 helix-turn-helix domain-containing protein [Pseudomonas sp. Fl5BN2]NBF10872.1 helix-turn-helix domain-containing protein [Pseudomonas sp. Fl4BN1]
MLESHESAAVGSLSVGMLLRELRQQARLSQLELALQAGMSQRHLSCVETGRAHPSAGLLHSVLGTLDTPLQTRNRVFLAAGYAPRYAALALNDPGLEPVRTALMHLLKANNPAPAIVIDSHWQVLAANRATTALFQLLGLPLDAIEQGFNLLATLLAPGGFGDCLINAEEIRQVAWQRAAREAAVDPGLATWLASLPFPGESVATPDLATPLLLTRVRSPLGELRFLSTFTTFGMPQDITVASLRIEHLIPADESTWQALTEACEGLAASEPG